MANPFDQFDNTPAANPFDQFDDPAKPSGAIRKLADKALGFASGAVGATKAIADAAGAGNAAARVLGDVNTGINDYLSPEAKADQQEQGAIMAEAQGKGTWEGVKAGAKAFAVAPVQTAVQGLGSIVPILAGSVLSGGAVPAAAVGAGIGAAMGAGTAKGAIFDDIKKRSLEAGMSVADATAAATKAQEYTGANTDQIALGGALGTADALTGVSRIAGNMARGALKKPVADALTTTTQHGILGRTARGIAAEMPLEAAQGGQEQLAANIAAQRAGYQAGTWDNVASNATLEALASAGPGAVFGALDRAPTPPGQPAPATPTDAPPAQPPLQVGNTPDPFISFADGTVARKSEVDAYINGLPPEQQPAARAKIMGLAPQPADQPAPVADVGIPMSETPAPVKPSEAMGLNPAAGPMQAAATIAVDTGVHDGINLQEANAADQAAYQQATAEQEKQAAQQDSIDKPITTGPIAEAAMSDEDKRAILFSNKTVADGGIQYEGTQDGDILNGLGKPYPTRFAAQRRARMEGKDWTIAPVFDGFVARRKDANDSGTTDLQPLPAGSSDRGDSVKSPSVAPALGPAGTAGSSMDTGRAGDQPGREPVASAGGVDAGTVVKQKTSSETASSATSNLPQPLAYGRDQSSLGEQNGTRNPIEQSLPGTPADAGQQSRAQSVQTQAARNERSAQPGGTEDGSGSLTNDTSWSRNVKDTAPATDTPPAQARVEAPSAVAGNAAATPGLPAATGASVEGGGVDQAASGVKTERAQNTGDRLAAGAKLFPNVLQANAIRAKGFDSLNVDRKKVVQSHMLTALHDGEILRSVVESVPIDVVNSLTGTKLTAKELLDQPSVLLDGLAASLDDPVQAASIGRFVNAVAASHPPALARLGAKEQPTFTPVEAPIPDGKSGSASVTFNDGSHSANHKTNSTTQEQTSEKTPEAIEAAAQQQAAGPVPGVAQPTAGNDAAAAPEASPAAAPVAKPGLERLRRARAAKMSPEERQWTDMTISDRETLATKSGVQGIFAIKVAQKVWTNIPEDRRAKMAALMVKPAPAADAMAAPKVGRFESIPVPDETTRWMGFDGRKSVRADLQALAQRHPEYYESAQQVRGDIEFVLGKPDGWYIHKGNKVVLFRERTEKGAIPQSRIEIEADADTLSVRSVYVGGKRQIAKKMADKREVLGGLDLGGQSPESLSIAGYLAVLGNVSSRPASPSGEVLKADASIGQAAPEIKDAWPAQDGAQPAAKAATIQDAGEKIGGARKDKWKERGLDLADLDSMSESEGAEIATKANVWKPDYEAMAEATEPVTAAMVKTVYDQLAAQPKTNTPAGRRNYVTMMQAVRKAYSEAKSPEDVKNTGQKIKTEIGFYSTDPTAKAKAREVLFSVYKGRSDPFVMGGYELMKAKRMVEDGFPAKGEPWKKRLSIRAYAGQGFTPRGIEITIEEAAELGTPLTTNQIAAGFYRINNKDGKAIGYAPTKADAEATAKTIYERDLKKGASEKPEPVRPNLDELKRENMPGRIDRDVTAGDFVKDLGFRGVEFGNWAAQDERQRIINMAYDGLMDLAEIMGVPPKAMSLNGTMGMAFGARGGGKFAAHYEPGKLVINMTKINGGGSMAHEWAHALDHYFGELNQRDAYATKARGASGWYDEQQYKGLPRDRMEKDAAGKWVNVTKLRLDNMRPEMAKAFDGVMSALFSGQETKAQMVRSEELAIERYQALADKESDPAMKATYQRGIASRQQALEELRKDPEDKMYPKGRSTYATEAQKLVGKSATGYWTRPTEMFARAFESWVFDKVAAMGARSDYLVHGVDEDRFAGGNYKGNPYPTGAERATINTAFDKLAGTIETKETDKGVAMFSRSPFGTSSTVAEVQKAIRRLIGITGRNQLGHTVATTAAEIKSHWEPLIDKSVNIGSEGDAGVAQAFYDPRTKTVFLLSDHISQGNETAVVAHELMHKHGPAVLGKEGWDRLHGVISSWEHAPTDSDERAIYSYAASKVRAVGMHLSSQEMLPYAVEGALKAGIKPNAMARQGTVSKWLAQVKQALRDAWAKVTNRPETFDAQDLVNLAFGIAQMENPAHAAVAGFRGTNESVTNPNDVVGNQGGRSADDIKTRVLDFAYGNKGIKPIQSDGMLAAIQNKTGRPIFVTQGNFGREQFKQAHAEAKAAGIEFDKMYVFADTATYAGPSISFMRLDESLPNESTAPDSGGTQFSRSIGDTLNAAANERKTKIVGETSRQYTPDQLAAMKAVGFQVELPSLKERAQALWQDAGKKLAQGIVDQFAPIKDIDKDAYGLLRLAKGASGAFEVFMHGGQLKLEDGVYNFDAGKRGGVVEKLLQPLQTEHHDFFRWIAANRAERLKGEGKENLFSESDIASLKTLADGVTNFDYTIKNGLRKGQVTRDRTLIYADSLKIFNDFQNNVLDMAEQSGLIDGEARKLWEHEFYVPFYRIEDDGSVAGAHIKNGVVRQQAFKSLTGRVNKLSSDLLDNTLMNWAHLLDASAKNRAAKATIEAVEKMGAAIPLEGNAGKGSVWFRENGQKRWALIDDPHLLTAVSALEYAGMRNPAMNAMGTMKRILTVGVTASPFFKIRNLIRDSVQVIGTSGINANPAANIAQGWKLTDPKSDAYFRLLAGGGTIHFGTMLEGSEAKRVQALVESGVDDSTILGDEHKVKAFYRKFIEPGVTAYNELGNRGEAINRAALYDQLIKQGMSHADASLQARDLMDFSMQGSFTTIRFLTQVVPFLNARIQGLYKLGRGAKEDPARFSAVLGATALFSLALLAAYSDDDDWKKREDWDRNNFWWFKFGGTAFRIPKPFEIGAIATLAERGAELAFDNEMTGDRFRKQVLTLLGDNLSMNPVPQLVKPILDVYANKDSFSGRPIETMGMDRLQPEYRFTGRTSMTARGLSTAANSVTGLVGAEALSPVQIDHMLRGYFGWLGSFVVGAGDVIARPATGQNEHPSADMWKTATGGIVSDMRDAPSRYVSQMYTQAREIEQAYGTWKALQKEGKRQEAAEFANDHKGELSKYHFIERVKRQESSANQRIRMIERSPMDGDAKRELISKIQAQKDQIARQVAG